MSCFDDWYSEPERGTELEALFREALSATKGEGQDELLAVFAELCMRRAWNAACVECLQLGPEHHPMGQARQVH